MIQNLYPVNTTDLSEGLLDMLFAISAKINIERGRVVVSASGEIPGLLFFKVES